MGWCVVLTCPACRYVVPYAPGLQQAATGISRRRMLWKWGTPLPPGLTTERDNASVWEGGRRQRSSRMPECNALDMVKGCQERTKERRDCPCSHRGHRQGLVP